ncbi:hypothetical protein ACFUGD_34985, partial [Streptomyces sp. NPDC057217]|uniref:hypothetical protein n=1 Tax=Streptomyces sp. NPDC057217 TaxID=3346054 RepID=UPI0036356771
MPRISTTGSPSGNGRHGEHAETTAPGAGKPVRAAFGSLPPVDLLLDGDTGEGPSTRPDPRS